MVFGLWFFRCGLFFICILVFISEDYACLEALRRGGSFVAAFSVLDREVFISDIDF
jgi:hypothetical protein